MNEIPQSINNILLQIFKSQDRAYLWWTNLDNTLGKIPGVLYDTDPGRVSLYIRLELEP